MNINSLDFVDCIFQESTTMNQTKGAKQYRYHKRIRSGNSLSEIFVSSSNSKNMRNYRYVDFFNSSNFDDLFSDFPFFN